MESEEPMAADVLLWLAMAIAWLSTLVGAPGCILMLLVAGVYGWSTGFREVNLHTLVWLTALAVPSEILDQLLGLWAARRYGASWTGLLGGFVGGMIGAGLLGSALPRLGVVLGALLGGFAGAYLAEYIAQRDAAAALRAAWGSFLGRMAGIALKMGAGLAMAWLLYRAIY
jgi:uncharacterized protein